MHNCAPIPHCLSGANIRQTPLSSTAARWQCGTLLPLYQKSEVRRAGVIERVDRREFGTLIQLMIVLTIMPAAASEVLTWRL